jgi:hypothetical protein
MDASDIQPDRLEKAINYCHMRYALGDTVLEIKPNLKPVQPAKFLAYSIFWLILSLAWLSMIFLVLAPAGRYSPGHMYVTGFPLMLMGYNLISYARCRKLGGYVPEIDEIRVAKKYYGELNNPDPMNDNRVILLYTRSQRWVGILEKNYAVFMNEAELSTAFGTRKIYTFKCLSPVNIEIVNKGLYKDTIFTKDLTAGIGKKKGTEETKFRCSIKLGKLRYSLPMDESYWKKYEAWKKEH